MKLPKTMGLAAVLTIGASQAALVDGLVNYWPLDGDANDAAQGLAGSSSTVADNGVIAGTNGTDGISYVTGLFGQSTSQNGAGGGAAGNQNDGFISIAGSVDTQFGGESLTTSLWVQVADTGFDTAWQAAIAHGEGNNYRIARRNEESVISYAGGVTNGDIPGTGVGPDITSGWHHIVATTENGGALNLYVDGAFIGTGAGPATIDNRTDAILAIGANPATGNDQNREWAGEIDDVAQWNRVLSVDEITQLYGGGSASAAPLGILVVPEPSSVALLALAGLGLMRRRR